MKWIVYYYDGSSFTSEDHEPWDIPRKFVICIAVPNIHNGLDVLRGYNYYCWHFDEEEWVPHNESGRDDYLELPGREKVVLRGLWVPKPTYDDICRRAKAEHGVSPTAGPNPLPAEEREKGVI